MSIERLPEENTDREATREEIELALRVLRAKGDQALAKELPPLEGEQEILERASALPELKAQVKALEEYFRNDKEMKKSSN